MPSFVKRVEKLSVDQRSAIEKLGFGNLLAIPNQTLSKSLLAELMERWDSERQVFLLQSGEIPITLMDVALILGIRVTGHQVLIREDEPFSDLEEEYGAGVSKRKIAIPTLESRLDSLDGVANDDFVRTFLLYLFGTFLFPNTNGKVDSRYLSFLRNMDDVGRFAWGAAVLEDLFMWLSKRKEMNVQYVGGCLIFLQIWSYEHIDITRPGLLNSHMIFPRACRWENGKPHQRQGVTIKFKELQDHQIIWKLQPSSEELEIDVIKELLEKQNEGKELPRSENSASEASVVNEDGSRNGSQMSDQMVVKVKMESEMDTINEVHSLQEFDLEQPMALQEAPEIPMDSTTEYPSTSYRASKIHDEDDLRTRNKILEDENMELKKELGKQKCENRILKNQLQSNSSLEEQIVELKKEVDSLRRENEHLSSSSDNLVVRLERILLEEDFSVKKETSLGEKDD